MDFMNQKSERTFPDRSGILIFAHFFFSAVCGTFACAIIYRNFFIVKESQLTGVSLERIVFFTVLLFIVLILYVSSFYLLLHRSQAEKLAALVFRRKQNTRWILWISFTGFLLCWMGYFTPEYLIFDGIRGYVLQLHPVWMFGCLYFISILTVVFFGVRENLHISQLTGNNRLVMSVLVIMTLLLAGSLFVVQTGFGVSIREDYWYGAGVPVLWSQIVLSMGFGCLFSCILSMNDGYVQGRKRIDLAIFLLVWFAAAILWAKEPLRPSHFMVESGKNDIYPYSDSATFDMGSQYALIGQGLFNGQYFDRSLYSAFLTYMHAVTGQDTETLMLLQAVLFSVFPAILYLIGREMHGRVLGVSLAFLVTLRGINSIYGTSLIDMAGPKMMLTDFPTAIGLSLIILFLLRWINRPAAISNSILAGAAVGFTLLLRTHVIFLLPFIFLYNLFVLKRRRIFWVYGSIFLILGMLVSTLPIELQNQKKGMPPFFMYYSRIQEVLKVRYGISSTVIPAADKTSNALILVQQQVAASNLNAEFECESRYCTIANHFFHNTVTSILFFPSSFVLDDFRHTVKETAPYWHQDWVGGGLTFENYLLLFINLTLISIGIAALLSSHRAAGLFPLMIFFAYILSNSLALTSGGRYITPVDWIICIYYVMGALKLIFWFLDQLEVKLSLYEIRVERNEILPLSHKFSFTPDMVRAFVTVFLIGCLIPTADVLFPRRYSQQSNKQKTAVLAEAGLLKEAGLSQNEISRFLQNPDARMISGRLLYPRSFPAGKGVPGLDYPYTALNYRRLVFMVIGPFNLVGQGVILPIDSTKPSLHAVDVMVLGCQQEFFLDALAVFILSEPQTVYLRPDIRTLDCPLPVP